MKARPALLRWYAPRGGLYPWRARPEPYAVLVSEFMLQQTQAARVVPAFRRFLELFPTVKALARASRGEVIRAWRGLGYNRRATALSEAARAIVRDHGGRVPSEPGDLLRLPGVGPYTAAAVASIAYGKAVPAVDANVRRILARIRLGVEPHEAAPALIDALAARWLDRADPGGWNQALMDLGREVCRPSPRCSVCPLANGCRFRAARRKPVASPRGQTPFHGSFRQLRGRVLDVLRDGPAALSTLTRRTGEPSSRVARAVQALHAEGLVRAGRAALEGRVGGRVALPE
jgi:A/G-specific adenine glycosylase